MRNDIDSIGCILKGRKWEKSSGNKSVQKCKSVYRLRSPSRCGSSTGQSLWWSRGQPVWGLRMYRGLRRSLSLEMELQEETRPKNQPDSLDTSEGKISPKSDINILPLRSLSPLSIFTSAAVASNQGRSHPWGCICSYWGGNALKLDVK